MKCKFKINRPFFFDQVRHSIHGGRLTAKQVEGYNTLLDSWETTYRGNVDDRYLAYALATTVHETAFTMQPIAEKGGDEYKRNLYDVTGRNPTRARSMGNTTPGDGIKYAGAGYVQLTWKANYEKAGKKIKVDLVKNPHLAMVPANAAAIMFEGMTDGWFTGKKLSDYFVGEKSDWTGARRIINGTDKAAQIGEYGKKYYAAIAYIG